MRSRRQYNALHCGPILLIVQLVSFRRSWCGYVRVRQTVSVGGGVGGWGVVVEDNVYSGGRRRRIRNKNDSFAHSKWQS